jgi:prepilin-type N-terminal cleavage/methylation domain-containing protein
MAFKLGGSLNYMNFSTLNNLRSGTQLSHTHAKGFTIVELLIVVVIIGILAAIVIVAYNGVTNRAKSSKSQSTASSIVKKLEAYNAENGSYPATWSVMDDVPTSSWYIPTTSYTLKTTAIASTDSEIQFNYSTCATAGKRITVWDYAAGAAKNYDVGGCSGTVTLVTS